MDLKLRTFVIEPFDGQNYESWRFKIDLLLKKEKCYEPVKKIPASKDQTTEWSDKNNLAMYLIGVHVSDDMIEFVRGHDYAFDMMKALKEVKNKESELQIVDLRAELSSMKYKMGDDVMSYCVKYRALCRRLNNLGDETSTRVFILSLLKTFPGEFCPIRVVLENKSAAALSWENASSFLTDFSRQLKESKAPAVPGNGKAETEAKPEDKAMVAGSNSFSSNRRGGNSFRRGNSFRNNRPFNRGNNNYARGNFSNNSFPNRGRFNNNNSYSDRTSNDHGNFSINNNSYNSGSNYSQVKCHYCNKTGHIARNCRAKQNRNFSNSNNNSNNGNNQNNCNFAANSEGSVSFLSTSPDLSLVSVSDDKVDFYVDSATNNNIVNDRSLFSDFITLDKPEMVTIAKEGVQLEVTGVGNVKVKTESGTDVIMKNVRYAKDIPANLLSVKRLAMAGFLTVFYEDHADIIYADTFKSPHPKILFQAKCVVTVLYLATFKRNVNVNNQALAVNDDLSKPELWHKRLAYVNYNDLNVLKSNGLLPIRETVKSKFCEPCTFGKQSRNSFKVNEAQTRFPLELVHSDVCMVTTISYDNCRYFVTFLDDYTHFCYVFAISQKSEVLSKFKEFCALASNRFNRQVMRLRCDRGTEYLNEAFKNYCNTNGIHLEPTMAYSPQQNGKAERLNRTLIERARTILKESKLGKVFWTEALYCAAYVINRCPTRNDFIPHKRWYGTDFDYNRLKIFGCDAYRFIFRHSGDKMVDKSEKLKFVGYAPGGYRLLNVSTKKVYLSRDVKFNELSIDSSNSGDANFEEVNVNANQSNVNSNRTNVNANQANVHVIQPNVNRNTNQQNINVTDFCFLLSNFVHQNPQTYQEAVESVESSKWKEAVNCELEALTSANTWTVVPRPSDGSVVTTRWVFTTKFDNSKRKIFKARLVARGFEQRRDFRYEEIYAPVAKLSTVRSLLAISNKRNFHIHQMDVCNAFLNGFLDESIYLEIPDGYRSDIDRTENVLLLNKSLYGLKQAPKAWNWEFNKFMLSIDFKKSEAYECLYISKNNGNTIYLLLYVDDILICAENLRDVERIKKLISQKFKCKDLLSIKNFLGLNVNYDKRNGILKIDQKDLINKVIERFNVNDSYSVSTPIEDKLILTRCNDQSKVTTYPYRELI